MNAHFRSILPEPHAVAESIARPYDNPITLDGWDHFCLFGTEAVSRACCESLNGNPAFALLHEYRVFPASDRRYAIRRKSR